jgi:hypothetical protein
MSYVGSGLGRRAAWVEAGVEPSLADILADPLLHLVMRRDGVTQAALASVIAAARAALARGLCRLAA